MPIEKVMEILNEFEVQAIKAIKLDHEIKADPYASVGKCILVRKIRKRINRSTETDNRRSEHGSHAIADNKRL
ncbi:MAG: hypothetical protein WC405_09125 [Syntrophales bacterium]